MLRVRSVVCLVAVAVVVSAAGAQVIDVGPHSSNYLGFSRGFSYIAPNAHTITNLELPLDNFTTGDLASYLVEVNDVVQVYQIGEVGAIAVNVPVAAGAEVLVVGNWTTGPPGGFTAKNSYNNTSPYPTLINGGAADLHRGGYQSDIGDGTYVGGAGFTGLGGAHGRIFVTVVPEPATLGLLSLGALALIRRR